MAGIDGLIQQAFADLSQLSSSEYAKLLKYYKSEINSIISLGQSTLSNIEKSAESYDIKDKVISYIQRMNKKFEEGKRKKVLSKREIEYYKNYAKVNMAIKNTEIQKQVADIESIIKKGYKILHELRIITTKQNTTFTVLVNIGTESQQIIKEVQLPLEEIINAGYLTADFHGGPSLSSTFKMRLQASKQTQKDWADKYTSTDITEAYQRFQSDKNNLLGITNIGRQYELFRKGSNLLYLQNSILGQYTSVNSDTTSFVKGVDSVSKDNVTGQYSYESLKSFIGGDPSLANLSTILSTLSNIQSAINNAEANIKQATKQQLNGSGANGTSAIDNMLRNEIDKRLREIFPSVIL